MVLADQVARGARRLSQLAAERGRPVPSIAVGGSVLLGSQARASVLDDFTTAITRYYGVPAEQASHLPITGSPSQAADRLAQYAAAGASHFVLGTIGTDWHQQVELLAEAHQLLH
jgi:alkanesulfonate monooxygenase SsuD/methylene tetrahydromethanopterin reductase-like flavin-dependent oxidoreductase (luciferase family)